MKVPQNVCVYRNIELIPVKRIILSSGLLQYMGSLQTYPPKLVYHSPFLYLWMSIQFIMLPIICKKQNKNKSVLETKVTTLVSGIVKTDVTPRNTFFPYGHTTISVFRQLPPRFYKMWRLALRYFIAKAWEIFLVSRLKQVLKVNFPFY